MKIARTTVLLVLVALLGAAAAGAQQEAQPGPPDRLTGVWESIRPVDTPLGTARVQVAFREEGGVRVIAWSTLPFVGKIKTTSGPYEVQDRTIHSAAIQGGTTVTYWFDEGNLVIRYEDGRVVRFQRVGP